MTRSETLKKKGWIRQSTHDEPRLSDVIDMYREIGLEVHLEPFNPNEEPGCTDCMKQDPEKYKTVYTKPK